MCVGSREWLTVTHYGRTPEGCRQGTWLAAAAPLRVSQFPQSVTVMEGWRAKLCPLSERGDTKQLPDRDSSRPGERKCRKPSTGSNRKGGLRGHCYFSHIMKIPNGNGLKRCNLEARKKCRQRCPFEENEVEYRKQCCPEKPNANHSTLTYSDRQYRTG